MTSLIYNITARANVNAASYWGSTPLLHAAHEGNLEVVRALIDAGANVNAADNSGKTPLMIAANGSDLEVVRCLIAAGANVYAADYSGKTLLIKAIEHGNVDQVRELARCLDVTLQDLAGLTAMSYAIRSKDPEKIATVYEYGGRLSNIDKEALEGTDGPTKLALKEALLRGEENRKAKVSQISEPSGLPPDISTLIQDYARL